MFFKVNFLSRLQNHFNGSCIENPALHVLLWLNPKTADLIITQLFVLQDLKKMAYAGLQMFMGYLKQIINCNDISLVYYNPVILCERPQFRLLYKELDFIILTLSNVHHHHHHNPEKVGNLKKRFKDVAKEAQDLIDLYLYTVNFRHSKYSLIFDAAKTETSLDLESVMRSIESIKVELMTINIDNMKMDPSPRIDTLEALSARVAAGTSTSSTRNPLGKMNPSMEEIIVGLDRDAEIIRDKLSEDTKQLSIVFILGMGGQGKTTLAAKLFNDSFIKYHFHIRAWATVSQTYAKRDLLIQILTSIGGVQEDLEKDNDSKLREKLHKKLMGRRYLIVIDDIWTIEAWDELKMLFPHENTRSRILLTSRQNEIALPVKPHGFVHSLSSLTEEESWELLKQKVFHGDECPEWLIEPGRQIARKCHGLPLSVVVIAGVLAEEAMSKDLWEQIACNIGSYQKENLETLALSYHHLPDHLRECFLYLGGFPEDFSINVKRVIRLWVAEGFIGEIGNQSLEDTAKAYLKDLINRNLVIVAKRNVIGDVKACKLHDLVRELCLQKAKEEGLFLKIDSPTSSYQLLEGITYEQRRIFTNQNVNILNIPNSLTPTIRTLLCFHVNKHSFTYIAHPFVLLRVLDIQECRLHYFPQGLALLIHLRYLAVWLLSKFPNSICKLLSLQTLILKSHDFEKIHLPCKITDLINLRHLWSNSWLHLPYIDKPMNLYSISKVMFKDGVGNFKKCFPNMKKLVVYGVSNNLELLPYLENLKLIICRDLGRGHIPFPATLKKLSLIRCEFKWSDMSIIQLLPNLEVLKLHNNLFTTGRRWDACEQQFRQLKLLKLEWLDIRQWEASGTSFPCLKQLSLRMCSYLEEIPIEIGEISTLELIEIDTSSNAVVESVKRIQKEQHDVGNYELKITVDGMELSFYSSHDGSSDSE